MAAEQRRSHQSKTDLAPLALGAAAVTAVAAGAVFLLRKSTRDDAILDDAPNWTSDSADQGRREVVGKTLLINRPRPELFAAWQDFERFPEFMDNVESVEKIDDGRSRWVIAAPAGRTVDLITRISEVRPGERIQWQSEPDSQIATSGAVMFEDAPADRGTYVSLVMSYEPPGGKLGKIAAKLFQREPAIQARRDLRRFKQLMETGEVTFNASPSGRDSESPTDARI
jgi:uncharacterized membrane protein